MSAYRQRILIVDDDPAIIKLLRANLEARGYVVLIAQNGAEAIQIFEKDLPHLVILDIMMPEVDGREVCRRIREWSQTPIIILSALGEMSDRVKSLDIGADDYITKPFAIDELMARIRAVLRRSKDAGIMAAKSSFTNDDFKISFAQRVVTIAGNKIELTPTEYYLLQELTLNAGKVLTHGRLLNTVWGLEYGQEKEYLRVYIGRLRAKLEPDPTNPKYIITVAGVGYQFRDAKDET